MNKELEKEYLETYPKAVAKLMKMAKDEGIQKGKLEVLNKIDTFMKQKTYCKESGDIIRIIPFEWEEFKKEIGGNEK